MDWKALNSRVADWKVQWYFKNLWNELSSLKFENVLIGGFNGLQKSMGWKAQFVEKNAGLSGTGFEPNLDSPVQSGFKNKFGIFNRIFVKMEQTSFISKHHMILLDCPCDIVGPNSFKK